MKRARQVVTISAAFSAGSYLPRTLRRFVHSFNVIKLLLAQALFVALVGLFRRYSQNRNGRLFVSINVFTASFHFKQRVYNTFSSEGKKIVGSACCPTQLFCSLTCTCSMCNSLITCASRESRVRSALELLFCGSRNPAVNGRRGLKTERLLKNYATKRYHDTLAWTTGNCCWSPIADSPSWLSAHRYALFFVPSAWQDLEEDAQRDSRHGCARATVGTQASEA